MKITSTFILLVAIIALHACEKKSAKQKMGYEPIYEDTSSLFAVTYEPQGQAVQNGGKIYLLGDTLYQVENDKGIHIIDISNKKEPENVGFISIRGCSEVAVNGKTIFANNYSDLLSLRINANQLNVLKRTPDAFMQETIHSLPPEKGPFICPVKIPGKIITGWRKVEITDPKCFY